MNISKHTVLATPLAADNTHWRGRIYALAIFLSVFAIVAIGASQTEGGGSLARQLQWLVLAGATLALLARSQPKVDRVVIGLGGVVGVLVLTYVCLSASWSVLPLISFKRALLLAIVAAMCISCFGQMQARRVDFLHWHYWPVGILLVCSLLTVLAWPGYGVTAIGWRGVASHKNELGQVASLGMLLYATLALRRFWLGAGLFLLALGLLAGARSSSCTLAVCVALGVGTLAWLGDQVRQHRAVRSWMLAAGMLVLLVSLLVVVTDAMPSGEALADAVFGVLGKSSTLTGRTELWHLVLENQRYQNPWLGGGYGGFWNGVDSISGYIAYRFGGGYVGQAHNGYLDLYNDLGWVGIGLLALFLSTWLQRIVVARRALNDEFLFHLMYFFFLVVLNITESVFWRTTQALNIVLIASFVRVNTVAMTLSKQGTTAND